MLGLRINKNYHCYLIDSQKITMKIPVFWNNFISRCSNLFKLLKIMVISFNVTLTPIILSEVKIRSKEYLCFYLNCFWLCLVTRKITQFAKKSFKYFESIFKMMIYSINSTLNFMKRSSKCIPAHIFQSKI